jgi:hypothetical protein
LIVYDTSLIYSDIEYKSFNSPYLTESQVESTYAKKSDITSVYKYKGAISSINELNSVENPEVGDVYNIEQTDMNYAWDGSKWDALGTLFDLSNYVTKDELPPQITVDTELSETSENPVQNKVVKSALDAKVDASIFRLDNYSLAIGDVNKAVNKDVGLAIGVNVNATADYPFIIGSTYAGILRGMKNGGLYWQGDKLAYAW